MRAEVPFMGGWQESCRSIAEVSGSLPRHAMWGSDGRVEWKERGAHRSLAAGKGNMKSIFAHPLSFSRSFYFLYFFCLFYSIFLLSFLILRTERRFLWFVGCHHTSTELCRPATRTAESSFLSHCFLRMWKRPPVTSESLISELMKSPAASSHHNHLVASQVWFCSVNVLWHFLNLLDCHCHA